jgi:hypothetical protein
VASASFSPCAGIFGCNPWALPVVVVLGIAALAVGGFLFARRAADRRRIWVTAQVDGGINHSLGWGWQHGVGLVRDDEGLRVSARPIDSAPIKIRYRGNNRFLVESSFGLRDVHQGDPAPVREGDAGGIHQLTVRLYRKQPREAARSSPPPAALNDPAANALAARLDGGDTPSAPTPVPEAMVDSTSAATPPEASGPSTAAAAAPKDEGGTTT